MGESQQVIDVFISRKSADVALANQLYRYFVGRGLNVFESDETLPKMGSSDYRKAIDHALDECKHMVVVGSSVENIASSWVEAEWGFYIGEKRAGRKKGNILTVITDNLEIKDLPASLRYYEVLIFHKENFDRVAAYVGKDYEDPKFKPPKKNFFKSKWFLPTLSAICLLGLFWYIIDERNKPFDATLFIKPSTAAKLHPSYPAFEGGELSLVLDNKEEKKSFSANSEIVLRQLPVSYQGKKVPANLTAKYWKLEQDSIDLSKTVNLTIVPDESLAMIYGNIKDENGNGIDSCEIADGGDTSFLSGNDGFFKVTLPWHMQKVNYTLDIKKAGYKPTSVNYFAGSGTTDIMLKK